MISTNQKYFVKYWFNKLKNYTVVVQAITILINDIEDVSHINSMPNVTQFFISFCIVHYFISFHYLLYLFIWYSCMYMLVSRVRVGETKTSVNEWKMKNNNNCPGSE